jgi:hypothetical protein
MTLLGLYCLDFRRGIAEEYDLGQSARTVLRCVEIATGELHACGTLELTRGPEDGRGEHQLSALERHRLVLARETARDVGTWGSPEVAAVLLDAAGSDAARMTLLSWRDNERWNCLHYAALWGSPETTKTLVETANAVGVLVQLLEDRTEDFSICLNHSAGWGSPEVLAVLLDVADNAGVLERLLKMHDKNYRTCLDAVPITKLFAGGEGDIGGHVL